MSGHLSPPRFSSHRRFLELKLSDLHKCSDLGSLLQIHSQIIRLGLHLDPFVAPKLITAYSLCRRPSAAAAVFDLVPNPNSHLFNTLIRAFSHNSLPSLSFLALSRMQLSAIPVDSFTYHFLLKSSMGILRRLEVIQAHIVKLGFLSDIFIPNTLIDCYSKVGEAGIIAARKVFDEMPMKDVVSWNSMIAALARAGEIWDAKQMFDEMPERDTVSWNTMLDGFVKSGEVDSAFDLFRKIPDRNVVSWSTMLSGYCKKGDFEMARLLFDKMPVRNLVPWTIMISGYAEKGLAAEASSLLDRMENAGLVPDSAATISILTACSESGLLALGKRIHTAAKKKKQNLTTQIGNALVCMYSKCGDLDDSWIVFNEILVKDLVSWNSMLQGLAMNGQGKRALELFASMKEEGITPDRVTFIGVLCACNHIGLIKEARWHFASMKKDYGIIPEIEHYGCMIDLLGRGGLLMEAYSLAKTMPFEANAIIWGSILNSCQVHNNVSIAERIVDELIDMEGIDTGDIAIISNIYASAGRWDGMAKARMKMKDMGKQKQAGSSWIEIDDAVHEFTVGDRMHHQADRILKMIDRLGKHLKHLGSAVEAA
ncbi:Pentatricopeptide repeat-containing protein [Apostasia shenzhenica]|uniref:Pentatricopeptide repeat-containing protein n=1 Tax=Apostasia shenzhenica TaxID=1088818 RepID=A0A2I0APA5_9ASPA|nr:Pentatricopeptide repeat-containing protein [Apostasia shenzhenica]